MDVFHLPLSGKTFKNKPLPLLKGTIGSWLVISGYTCATPLEVTSVTTALQLQNTVRRCWNCEASSDDCMKLLYHSQRPEKVHWFEDVWKGSQPFQQVLSETLPLLCKEPRHGWLMGVWDGSWVCESHGAMSGTGAAGQVIDLRLYSLSFINVVEI